MCEREFQKGCAVQENSLLFYCSKAQKKDERLEKRKKFAFHKRTYLLGAFLLAGFLMGVSKPASADTTGHLVFDDDHSTWTMTENHRGTIEIDADYFTLDCNNHNIYSDSSVGKVCRNGQGRCGILVSDNIKIQIKNCSISNYNGTYDTGIEIKDSYSVKIQNSFIQYSRYGILARNSEAIYLQNLDINFNTKNGIDLYNTDYVNGSNLDVSYNAQNGVVDYYGFHNKFSNSSFSGGNIGGSF